MAGPAVVAQKQAVKFLGLLRAPLVPVPPDTDDTQSFHVGGCGREAGTSITLPVSDP